MRIDRIAFAIALSVSAVSPASALVLGGGPAKTDCYAAFDGVTVTRKSTIVECTDGDPTCDFDTTPGMCTFKFKVCTSVQDVAGCTPLPLRKITPRNLKVPALGGTAFVCGEDNLIVLKLKKRGRPTKRLINMLAQATGKPPRDPDRLRLTCVPRPASPSGAFVLGGE